ncbi:MAG TPA: peptidase MA family metallohydrolase, partial [Anaerolineales bacterium]|nr:peptidase MA family metallohydrolase [Anaerolineales bacterium]
MYKKILQYLCLLGGFLFLTGFLQTSPQINDNSLEINFPKGLIFHLDVSHTSPIQRVTLIYGTDGRTCQNSSARQDMEFDASTQVTTSWEWEFKKSGTLPPGVEITWQWELEDAEGNITTTPTQSLVIQDLRNDWEIIDRDDVVVQWYVGSNDFGEDLHAIALESLARLEQQMGIRPVGEIYLTIYPSAEEVREAVYFSPEWTGGLAFPEYDASIMGIAPDELEWAGQVIPHELTHLIVGTLTFNCKAVSLPT